MQRYVLKCGEPDSLRREEVNPPHAMRGQVLVRMRAASLNYRDLLMANGAYPADGLPDLLVPLSDGAGEIVEVGEDVTGWSPGDRVSGIFSQDWQGGQRRAEYGRSELGGTAQGVLAEYRCFQATGIVRIPDHLSFAEAATLPCAAVTAWNALQGGPRPVRAGETVLLIGTGGVSSFALPFAVTAGARVIVISSSDVKLQHFATMGADELVNYRKMPDWQDAVRELTDGAGVDHVVETGGPGTLERSLGALKMGGQVHLIGVLSMGRIDPIALLGSAATVRGILVGSREMFVDMNQAITLHGIRPLIEATLPFAEAPEAYRLLQSATHVGKIVIEI